MLLRFTKMHGLGNDFMVLDLISQHAHIQPKHAKAWGDRHTGVGFDQLLLVEAPTNPDVDVRYRIFNSDGSEVEQCGNGARCFARFVVDKRLTVKKQIRVETKGGIIELNLRPDGQVTVDMGAPRLVPEQIPFQLEDDVALTDADIERIAQRTADLVWNRVIRTGFQSDGTFDADHPQKLPARGLLAAAYGKSVQAADRLGIPSSADEGVLGNDLEPFELLPDDQPIE